MMGKLVSKDTRTVYNQKVVRLTMDIPFGEVRDSERDGQDLLKFLDNRVDNQVSINIAGVENEGQELINDR